MCNISATSGLIFKILEPAYFWHFYESNGVQCIHCTLTMQPHYHVKQLLSKLQFFTGNFLWNARIIMTSLAKINVINSIKQIIIKLLVFYEFLIY